MFGVGEVLTGATSASESMVSESQPPVDAAPLNEAAAAGPMEAMSAPGAIEKDSGAFPVGAIRSLSGTPSIERESERPDAEGGYENDQPPANLANPPLIYTQA